MEEKKKDFNAKILFVLVILIIVLTLNNIFNTIIEGKREEIVEIKRSIDNQGELYAITLNLDVNKDKRINAFVITEYYPKGWEVQNVSHGGVYNTSSRLDKGVIEWLGSEFTELKAEDAVITYVVKKTNDNDIFDGDWVAKNPDNNVTLIGDIRSDSDEELASIGIFGSSDEDYTCVPNCGSCGGGSPAYICEYFTCVPNCQGSTPSDYTCNPYCASSYGSPAYTCSCRCNPYCTANEPEPEPTPPDSSDDYTPEPTLPEPTLPEPTPPEPTPPDSSDDYTPEPTLPEPTLPEPTLPEPVLTNGSDDYTPDEPVTPEPYEPITPDEPITPTNGSEYYPPKKQEDPCDNECSANVSMSKKGSSQFKLYGEAVQKASSAANDLCNENPKFGLEYSCAKEQAEACCKGNNLVSVVDAKIYPERELSGTCSGSLSGITKGYHITKIGVIWEFAYIDALKKAGGKAERALKEQLKGLNCGDGCVREINISEARTRITKNVTTRGQYFEATIIIPFTAKCAGEKTKRRIRWVADVNVELYKQCSIWKWKKDPPKGCG